jgi:hypothetical protein
MKKCIILRPSHDHNGAFHPEKYFFNFNKLSFQKHGYEVIEYNIINENDIVNFIQNTPDNSIGFLWIQGHGTPKTIQLGEYYKIHASEINTIFSALPSKLTGDAHILLDSCSTGKFDNAFYDNVQFGFGKLTKDMLDVKIIAPTDDTMSNLTIGINDDTGDFSFYVTRAERGGNIISALGENTKSLLNESLDDSCMNLIQESMLVDRESSQLKGIELKDMQEIREFSVTSNGKSLNTQLSIMAKKAISNEDINLFNIVAKYLTPEDLLSGTSEGLLNKNSIKDSVVSFAYKKILENCYKSAQLKSFYFSELPNALYEIMSSQEEKIFNYYLKAKEIFRKYGYDAYYCGVNDFRFYLPEFEHNLISHVDENIDDIEASGNPGSFFSE